MIKKITALALSFVMLLSVSSFAAVFTDVAQDGSETSDAIGVLSELGVLSGMGDGTFLPEGSLTRAQFAKIAVCIMGKTDEAVVTTDAFSDVKSTDWYSGFVNVVANEGIITGYPDGSFGANDNVTYAQAITVLIRLLDYNAEDVGHKWPQGYLDKAKVLKITEGLTFDADDPVNRSTAALLIYRALFTDIKGTTTNLVTRMDNNVYEDAVITATNKQNTALMANQVETSVGTFTYDASVDVAASLGCEGTLVTNDEGDVIAFVPSVNITKADYTIRTAYSEGSGGSVTVLDENGKSLTLDNNLTMYAGNVKTTLVNLAEGVNPGSTLTIFTENGSVKYAYLDEYKNEGPKVVRSKSTVETLFDIENKSTLKVIRKGLSATMDDIELYDVLYYSQRTNTIYAYADRVTGMYEEAYPMKSNVTRVKVSGTEYTLSTLDAINMLNESDYAFKLGDRVTLLLGENGDVVDAVSLTEADLSVYGVITGTGSEISTDEDTKGRTEYYVNVMHSDGNTVKYLVKTDKYEDKAGSFCEVDFENGYAVLTFPASAKKTGVIDKDAETLGDYPFASDYAVLEYVDGNETQATVIKLTLSSLDGIKILNSDVKHLELNEKGEIVLLYLNDVSGNGSVYGVIVEAPDDTTKSGSYKIMSGSETYTVTGTYNSYAEGDCVVYKRGVAGIEIGHMVKVASGTAITSYTDNIIKIDGRSYTMSDTVVVYHSSYSQGTKTISLDDALNLSGTITLYSDKGVNEGGKIRIIRIIAH